MKIETERLVIRDLEQKDKEQLFRIVWQKDVVRFMRDWSVNQIDDSFGHSAGTSASGMSRNSCEVRTESRACVTAIIRALRANDSRMPGVSMGYAYFESASSHIQNAVEETDTMLRKNKSAKS